MSESKGLPEQVASYVHPGLACSLRKNGINIPQTVFVLSNFAYNAPVYVGEFCVVGNSYIDAYSYCSNYTRICNVDMGAYCSIGHNVDMGLSSHNYKSCSTSPSLYNNVLFHWHNESYEPADCEWVKQTPENKAFPKITIGCDVWIGAHSIFPKSVNIGHGAVIGAGTVVTKDVPPYAVVVNHHGKTEIIKYRFTDEQISDLLELQWWQYDLPSCKQLPKLKLDSFADFMAFFKNTDLSELPKLPQQWKYYALHPDPAQVKVFLMGNKLPLP